MVLNPAEELKNCNKNPIPNSSTNPTNNAVPLSFNSSILTSPALMYPHAHCAIKNAAPTNANVRRILNTPCIWPISSHRPLFPTVATPPDPAANAGIDAPATMASPANPNCFNNLLKHKEYRQLYFRSNIEFFHEFIPYFEKEGIIATIENVHEPDWELIRSIVATINSPNLKATIDIGHCNLHSDYPISEWIKNYGIMLHHMHFHNNYKDEDSHSSLLKGSLDIEPVIKTLNEMQLSPQITFEIFDKDELFESVKYFDDIADKIKQG